MNRKTLLAAGILATPATLFAQASSWSKDGFLGGSYHGFRGIVIGDYNGNGTDDVVLGEPGDNGALFTARGGSATVYDGNGNCLMGFYGQPWRRMGTGLARFPDVNGDGKDEVLVGSPGYAAAPGGYNNGRIEMFLGGTTVAGQPPCTASGATTPTFLIDVGPMTGTQINGDEFGHEIEVLGDLDADGVADFAVGAPGGHQTPTANDQRGYVMVYSTGTVVGGTPTLLYRLDGVTLHGRFGTTICNLGDLTGDGVAEIAVGAPDEDFASQGFSGRVHCFNGATGALFLRIQGAASQHVGTSIENVGDVNGDGRADIAIGAPDYKPSGFTAKVGMVAVVDGNYLKSAALAGGVVTVSYATMPTIRRLRGDDLYSAAGLSPVDDTFGYAIANVLDVDGDGVDDMLVGAPGAAVWDPDSQIVGNWPFNFDMFNVGGARLVSGATGYCIKQYYEPAPQANDAFGSTVIGGGDLDKDGIPDLLIAAPYRDDLLSAPQKLDVGRTYAWSGDVEFGYVYGAGLPNSTSQPGRIVAKGAQTLAADKLRFEMSNLPAGSLGMLLMSAQQLSPPVTVGSGLLYLQDPTIFRFNAVTANDAGIVIYEVDLSVAPAVGNIVSLSRWNLQFWHRDVGATVNFTDAITVGFY